jgi:hypothetical protein
MKTMAVVTTAALLLCAAVDTRAQFKGQVERESQSSGGVITQPGSFMFGWFDPERFSMHHSVGMSYVTSGGQGMSLGTYTNSMMYRFTDNFNVQTDVSMSYSPFNSFSTFGGRGGKDFSGIYLSRAQLNYKPWENVSVQLQYQQIPYGYFHSPFAGPWYRENGF